jgi:phosphoribosylformylglycinamidine synthase
MNIIAAKATIAISHRHHRPRAGPPIIGQEGEQGVKLAAARRLRHRGDERHPIRPSTMKARVFVTLKPGVLDPQGRAIHHALEGLGFSGINDVRAGKLIELDLAEGTSDGEIESMCRKLLANTVIENFRIERHETV